MRTRLHTFLAGASCVLLPFSASAEVSFLSGVALPNGGEIVSFADGSLLSTNSIGGASASHSIQAYTLGSNGALSSSYSVDLNGVFNTAAGTSSISSVLNDARGFGVATVIPTATSATDFGRIAIFDKSNGSIIKTLDVGYHPDSVTITPDGTKLLIANEGEYGSTTEYSGNQATSVATPEAFNRPGSVSVISLNGITSAADITANVTQANVVTYDFSAPNLAGTATIAGVRNSRLDTLTVKTANIADIEPEYITASNNTAYITLQENNAIATLDLVSGKFTSISSLPGISQVIDASDRDGPDPDGSGPLTFSTLTNRNDTVVGLPMPDTMTKFERAGSTYLVTANEGDARPDDGDLMRAGAQNADRDPRPGSNVLLNPDIDSTVDPIVNNTGIGRLNILKDQGDTDLDGDIDVPTMMGTRSFTIWKVEADGSLSIAFDSDAMIEEYVAANNPSSFNMNSGLTTNTDTRSDDKGPEPEALAFGSFDGKDFVFIGNERENGIFQFDITDLNNVFIAGYFNPVTGTTDGVDGGVYISPESMLFLAAGAAGNSTGKNLLIVGFEGTGGNGSIGVFEVTSVSAIPEPSTYAALAGLGALGLAVFRRRRVS